MSEQGDREAMLQALREASELIDSATRQMIHLDSPQWIAAMLTWTQTVWHRWGEEMEEEWDDE